MKERVVQYQTLVFDLIGADPGSKHGGYFKTNNAGWCYICRILEGLGCDTSALSGDNSGDYVPKAQAAQFGKALSAALEKDLLMEMPLIDKHYVGSVRHVPFVRENLKPVLDFESSMQPVFIEPIEKFLRPIDRKTKNWLKDAARFLSESGGFFQC